MKTRNIFCLLAVTAFLFGFSACSEFLDENPDNRTTLDSEDKVIDMLVSAYPQTAYIQSAEFSSDNVDQCAMKNPDYTLCQEQLFNWQEVTDNDNEAPSQLWESCYNAIASANTALEAIEKMGGATTAKLKAARGEALLCRAYSHFILVNIFCQAYDPRYSDKDMGVPYMESVETDLLPSYTRGTIANVYDKIDQDLVLGLPLINDMIYTTPKYHFNQKAAYAFAARFYLFYQKWDRAIECADKVLGSAPEAITRDMEYMGSLNIESADRKRLLRTMEYINALRSCNLLLQTSVSELGTVFGPYTVNNGFNHGNWLTQTETFDAPAPFGTGFTYYVKTYTFNDADGDKALAWRVPYLFEYTDPVNLIGLPHIVFPAFTVEETLLVRAEAYIMKKQYAPALADMNLWVKVYVKEGASTMTESSIAAWVRNTAFYTPANPTPKKEIVSPSFQLEAGTQTNMCYALLHLRRLETLHLGLRWFDVKRYGITIYRRKLATYKKLDIVTGALPARDPRCAIQLPQDVVSAGMAANPR